MATHIPPGYQAVIPYLSVAGADRLVEFLCKVFDAEVIEIHRDGSRIRHGALRVAGTVVELSDASPEWGKTPAALHVYLPDIDAAHARAVAAGATVMQDPTDQPYGERSSAVVDPCGNRWYLATLISRA